MTRTRPIRSRSRLTKAYSSRAIRGYLLPERVMIAAIPEPADQQGPPPTPRLSRRSTPSVHAEIYKGRNVNERRFGHLKQWRGLATRYDKLPRTYRAAVVLNTVITWTRHLSDMH